MYNLATHLQLIKFRQQNHALNKINNNNHFQKHKFARKSHLKNCHNFSFWWYLDKNVKRGREKIWENLHGDGEYYFLILDKTPFPIWQIKLSEFLMTMI